MGKAVRVIALSALAVGAVVLTAGAATPAIAAALGVSTTVAGAIAATAGSLSLALASSGLQRNLGGRPGFGLVPFDPKNINIDKAAPRKLVFGRTAMPLDLRHAEPSADSKQEYITYIFACAGHKVDAYESLYIEEKLAWNGSAAVGEFAGYLTIETQLEAATGSGHTAEGGTKWNATNHPMTGCATIKMRVKRSGNSSSSQSPFASGIPGRMTLIGRGMPVYDPARDSTVPGGSGTHRANDRSTWEYTAGGVTRGNNPALQLLAYLLGWTINGVGSVGLGIDPARINLPSFAAAAAICDESVALAAGGSHRRYEAGKAYTDADDPAALMAELLAAMNGELVHDSGKLALRLGTNDLTPILALTEDDFISGITWNRAPPLAEQFTVVRGRYSQPDAPSLFGLADYPEVSTGRVSIAPRPLALELPAVQDSRRAERIATQVARLSATAGTVTVTLGIRGWGLRLNAVVAVSSQLWPESGKLFRVRGITLNPDATVTVDLRPEFASSYAWGAAETNVPAPVTPVPFNLANADLSGAPAGTYVAGVLAEDIAAGGSTGKETVALAIGTSATIVKGLQAGESFSANAFLKGVLSGASGTLSISLERSVSGSGTWTAFGSSTSDAGSPPDTLAVSAEGSYTNSSGGPQTILVRATGVLTAGTLTVAAGESFLRA